MEFMMWIYDVCVKPVKGVKPWNGYLANVLNWNWNWYGLKV